MRLRFSARARALSVLAALAVVPAQGQSQRPERPNRLVGNRSASRAASS